MVASWYMKDPAGNKQEENQLDEPQSVSLEDLKQLGVLYFSFPEECSQYEALLKDRKYNYSDVIRITRDSLPDYDKKLEIFFTEHLHEDEEIRYIKDGSGYFDIRDKNDKWIRILVEKGDLLILPAGIYHRFTLDTKNFIEAKRLFCGVPVWTPHNRPADDHPARTSYMKTIL